MYTSFLLDRQFHGQLRLAIELEFSALDAVIDNALRNDAWQPRALFVEDVPVLDERDVSGPQHHDDDGNDDDKHANNVGAALPTMLRASSNVIALQLTESAHVLYEESQRFMRGTTRVVTLELSPTLARGFERLFARYLSELARRLRGARLTAAASLAVLASAANIVGELVPRVVQTYQRALGDVPLRPMEEMAEACERLFDSLRDIYCQRRCDDVVVKKYAID